MIHKPTMNVELVAPAIWEEQISVACAQLTPAQQQSCQAIITSLHNRHVGISPFLAAQLAQILDNQHSLRFADQCWALIFQRILNQSSTGPMAILPHRVPIYIVLRVAAPLISQACLSIGKCYLFCQDSSPITRQQYQQYSQQLEEQLRSLLAQDNTILDTFWHELAFTLTSYSRRAPLWGATATRLAELHPPALSLLLGIHPPLPHHETLTIHPKTHVNPIKNRPVKRLTEGGFSGIHISRGLEDMGDILLSEFLNPPAVLADRLINNGYLTLQRETKREQLRDVLIVGMLPASITPKPSVDFIKACWFDFIARFGFLLYRCRLLRSEFRWLEGDSIGRVAVSPFLLKELPHLDVPVGGDLTPVFRRQFLTALGWLPQYLDNRRSFEKVPLFRATPGQLQVAGEKDTANERLWAYSAWRAQRENLLWNIQDPIKPIGGTTPKSEKRLDLTSYAYLHIMLFLPAQKRGPENSALRLGPLYSGLGISQTQAAGLGQHCSASITWVPETITDTSSWAFDARESFTLPLFPHSQSTSQTAKPITIEPIAARLEEVWRSRLLKELQDDR